METVVSRAINQLLNEVKAEIQSKLNKRTRTMPGVDVRIELGSKSMAFKNASGEIQDGLNESAKLGAVYSFVLLLMTTQTSPSPSWSIRRWPVSVGGWRSLGSRWCNAPLTKQLLLINSSEKEALRSGGVLVAGKIQMSRCLPS